MSKFLCSLLGIVFLVFSAQAQVQPADPIAGRWKSDAQFIQKNETPTPEYFWVGPISGDITPTGKITMASANGCNFSGLLTPVNANKALFNGAINVTGCKHDLMNRTYTIDVTYIGGNLKIIANNKFISGGRIRASFDITTTLSKST